MIHDRWQRWEQPDIAEMATLSPSAAQAGVAAVFASEAGRPKTTHLYVRMPSEDLPRAVVTTDSGGWCIDDTGRIVGREANGWTEFLIGLHEYLHLPSIWGMIPVGALGAALVALVLTGGLTHPRIVRDASRLRTRHDPQIVRADWHKLRTPAVRAPDAVPTYVIVHDPATRGQHVQIIAALPRRLVYGETCAFDARGGWRGPVGLSEGALGQQAAASAYNPTSAIMAGWRWNLRIC